MHDKTALTQYQHVQPRRAAEPQITAMPNPALDRYRAAAAAAADPRIALLGAETARLVEMAVPVQKALLRQLEVGASVDAVTRVGEVFLKIERQVGQFAALSLEIADRSAHKANSDESVTPPRGRPTRDGDVQANAMSEEDLP